MREELIKANHCFVKIAQEGSVAKACESINITPNTIRKLIAYLQKYLASELFVSHSKGVTLTEDGQKYYDMILPSMDAFNQSIETNKKRSDVPTNQLKYKIFSTTQGAAFLSRYLLKDVFNAFPNYLIELPSASYYFARNYGSHLKSIIEGSDLLILDPSCVSLINPDYWNLSYRFNPVNLQLYASKEYLKKWGKISSVDDLHGIDFIVQNKSELDAGQLVLLNNSTKDNYKVDVNVICEIAFHAAKIELIRQGAGIGLITSNISTDYLIKDLVPVLPDYHSNKKLESMILTKQYHTEITSFIVNKLKNLLNEIN